MIFYYIIFFLYNTNFANTSFILDPIYQENIINCQNNIYSLNSIISYNNAIIKDSLSLNTDFSNNENIIVFQNNNLEGIQFINLPITQPDNYYLTLNDKNILSIYINFIKKTNNIVYYDSIEAKNIISGKYGSLSLTSPNGLVIGDKISKTTINIHGKKIFAPFIKAPNINTPINIFSNESNNIIFNNGIAVSDSITNSSTATFENLNIKTVLNTNLSMPLEGNIFFIKNLEIQGDQLNSFTINITPPNQILNCNFQDIIIQELNDSNLNNFIQIDQNDNSYRTNVTLGTNYLNAFNTNSNTITLANGNHFTGPLLVKPLNKTQKNVFQINNLNVENFYLNFFENNKGNNVIAKNFTINYLDYNAFDNFINQSNNIYIKLINLDIHNNIQIANNDVILNSKNIYLGNLNSNPTNNLLGFDLDGILCLQNNTANNNNLVENINTQNKNYTQKKNELLKEITNFQNLTKLILNETKESLEIELKKTLYQLIMEIMQL